MVLPNFFIVGAAKSGTTSLYHYLLEHPEIYMSPIKEPNFFCTDINPDLFREDFKRRVYLDLNKYFSKRVKDKIHGAFIRSWEHYFELFEDVSTEPAVGEASVSYLFSKVAARNIKNSIPNAKIIIILRNPIERAFSHYLMNLSSGISVKKDFLEELITDINKEQKGWGISHLYIELGMYYEQVKRYMAEFPPEQVRIFIYDEFKADPQKILKEIFEFLGVDNTFQPDLNRRYNVSYIPSSIFSESLLKLRHHSLIKQIIQLLPIQVKDTIKKKLYTNRKPPLSEKAKLFLKEYFREDIIKLSNLINKDLTYWLEI